MASRSNDKAERFAQTFAPEKDRQPLRRSEHLWVVGLVLVLAGAALLLTSRFAFQQNLPTSGPFAMRPSPGLSLAEIRNQNRAAAPFAGVSALPLLGAGLWMLLRRPSNRDARAAAIVATIVFSIALAIAAVAT